VLEARGVEARSEEHNQAGALLFFFELALFDSRKNRSMIEIRIFPVVVLD